MSLSDVFLQHLGSQARVGLDLAGLEERLQGVLTQAKAGWPGLKVSEEAFVQHLASLLPDDEDAASTLEQMHVADVYLSLACALGDPGAIEALERDVLPHATVALGQGTMAQLKDDVVQTLRMKLLVSADGGLPRIAGYSGRGPLKGWIRVIAARTLIDVQRAQGSHSSLEEHAFLPLHAGGHDPEVATLRRQYREEFRLAFAEVLQGLSSREGAILRLYFLQGLTAEALGGMYKVSIRTVRRWIADTRERVFEATYAKLVERLRLSSSQVGSLLTILETDLDMDIAASLGAARGKTPTPTPEGA